MNQVYRVVFNRSLGVWQCVAETAKARGKTSSKIFKPLVISMSLVSGSAMATNYMTTTTISNNPYIVTNDTIDGFDTVVTAQDIVVGNTEQGQLNVVNTNSYDTSRSHIFSPTLNANKISLGQNQGVTGTLNIQDTHGANERVTALVTNVASDLLVGVNGTGNLNVTRRSLLKVGGNIVAGVEATSTGNLIRISEPDNNIFWNSQISAANNIIIGDKGSARLEVNSGSISAKNQFILGNKLGSYGEVLHTAQSGNSGGSTAIIGNEGTGLATIYDGGMSADTMIIGAAATGKGTVNVIGDGATDKTAPSFGAKKVIVGDAGQGTVNINGLYNGDSWSFGLHTGELILGNQKGSQGTFNMGDGVTEVQGNLIVGNEGSGTLNAKDAILDVRNIIRNEKSQLSNVNFDNTSIHATVSEPNFFAGFNANSPIKLNNSFMFDVYHENNNDTTPNYVTINPNAVLTGNVGKLPDNFISENNLPLGFIKLGDGTLEMSANSMQWTGDTIVGEGTMKINGDYSLKAGNRLGIALLDNNEDGTLADSSYGKFIFTNKADISQGDFYVYADKAIENTPKTTIWKDVIIANNLVGQFKSVQDNSPLVDFYADYSNPNHVNLQLTAPVSTNPVTPPTNPVTPPTNPVTPPTDPVTPPTDPVSPPTDPVLPPTDPVLPPTEPAKTSTFVNAVTKNINLESLPLAKVLDASVDQKINTGSNALADKLITTTLNFGDVQLSQTTSELQPLFMGSVNRMIADSNNLAVDAIHDPSISRERSVWAKAIGTQSTKDHKGNLVGYDNKDTGVIVGGDIPFNNKMNLGLAVSYISSDADTNGHIINHEMTADSLQVLGYVDYQATPATKANFHIGAGQSDIKGKRHIGLVNMTAASDYSANTLQAGMGLSHRIGSEQKNITPFAEFNYAQIKSNAYKETGADAFNLAVDKQKYNSMRSTLGVHLSQPIGQKVALTGTLAGAIENGDPRTDITASFVNAPNSRFTTMGQEVGREVGIAGVGLNYKPTANTSISANYMGEWRNNYDNQGASLVFTSKF